MFNSNVTHFINGSDSDLTDYQVKFTLWNTSGTSSGENVYLCSGTTQTDWDDIRFATVNNTCMDYWIESTNATSAVVWTEIPYIAFGTTNQTEMRIFYGNSSAVSVSNGDNTFLFFDHFASLGAVWAGDTGSASVSSSIVTISSGAAQSKYIYTTSGFPADTVVRWYGQFPSTTSEYASEVGYMNNGRTLRALIGKYINVAYINFYLTVKNAGGSSDTSTGYPRDANWHIFEVMRNSTSSVFGYVDVTGVIVSTNVPTGDIPIGLFSYNQGQGKVDWILVRQYAATEPAHGTYYAPVCGVMMPISNFTSNVTTGCCPLSVAFNDTSENTPTSWYWDVDNDGNVDYTTQNCTHIYTLMGVYSVNLTAASDYGTNTTIKSDYINISCALPYVNFTADSYVGSVSISPVAINTTINFTDYSIHDVTSWNWSFGDGSYSESHTASHDYSTVGNFTVTLTVTNASGTNASFKYVNITRYYAWYDGDYIVCKFNESGYQTAWKPKNNKDVTYLVVGGGGGGGRGYNVGGGGGGGAGGLLTNATSVVAGVSNSIFVGLGGRGATVQQTRGEIGQNTTFGIFTSNGGGGGGGGPAQNTGGSGGSGGGGARYSAGGYGTTGQGYNGGSGGGDYQGAGGGGAGEAGNTDSNYYGGDGVISSITGTATYYAGGGGGSCDGCTSGTPGGDGGGGSGGSQRGTPIPATSGVNGRGGGGGGDSQAYAGGNGGSGVIILRYRAGDSPISNLTSNVTTGCVPLSVMFNDTSTSDPTSWAWDIDNDGTVDYTTQNCSHTYSSVGLYTVNLTTSNDGGSNTTIKTNYINVTGVVANFTSNVTSGATPLTVRFYDNSTCNPDHWNWDVNGDEVVDYTTQNPSHTYSSAGSYTVNLYAYNTYSGDWENKTSYITVGNAPVAEFSADDTVGAAPHTVVFTGAATGTAPINYYWDVNNDGTFDYFIQSPTHVYSSAGVYTVKLFVNSSYGSDWENKTSYITVGNAPTASFTGAPTIGSIPLTVTFTDSSTGDAPLSYAWDVNGDGSFDYYTQNPSHVYSSVGSYTVKLRVTNTYGVSWLNRTNYITTGNCPAASFTGAPRSSDTVPLSVAFTDTSTNTPTAWYWDVDNDGVVDYVTQNCNHNYNAVGKYTVNLTVTNAFGVSSSVEVDYIRAGLPNANFYGDPRWSEHKPLEVSFTDISTGSPTSWAWDFGDGATSTEQNPTHEYHRAGTYSVVLRTVNVVGEAEENKVGYVSVGELAPITPYDRIPVTPRPTTTFGVHTTELIEANYNVTEYADILPTAFTDLINSDIAPQIFWGTVFMFVFIALFMRVGDVPLLVLFGLVAASTVLAFIPGEWQPIAQGFLVVGLASIFYILIKGRFR